MNYYIADLHLFHSNIIKLNNRPFKNVTEMNETIVNNYNSIVTKKDTVYFLGDMMYPKNEEELLNGINLIRKLNGKKILIAGNHDRYALRNREFKKLFFEIRDYMEIIDSAKKVVMFHYPMQEWNGFFSGAIHLHGHTHNNKIANGDQKLLNRYNVGVDVTDFKPVTLSQLISK